MRELVSNASDYVDKRYYGSRMVAERNLQVTVKSEFAVNKDENSYLR